MFRYFIQLSYDGTNYHGWQIQKNATSVQEALQVALSKVLKAPVQLCGAGRTDTGVHAREMFAHFDHPVGITDTVKLVHQLNGILAQDVAIDRIDQVTVEAHARFDAVRRRYVYKLIQQKDPFLINKAYYFCPELNMELMNRAAAILLEYTDFTSFSKLHTDTNTNDCKITHAQWKPISNGMEFTIEADRFLRNMVRAIVGTLINIGTGKMDVAQLRQIIESKNRSNAGYSVPAHGLYLDRVYYPEHIFKTNEDE